MINLSRQGQDSHSIILIFIVLRDQHMTDELKKISMDSFQNNFIIMIPLQQIYWKNYTIITKNFNKVIWGQDENMKYDISHCETNLNLPQLDC